MTGAGAPAATVRRGHASLIMTGSTERTGHRVDRRPPGRSAAAVFDRGS